MIHFLKNNILMKKFLLPLFTALIVLASCDDTTDGVGASLTDLGNRISVTASAFDISTESVIAESVIARTSTGFLGKVKDPETGTYITGNFMTQFHTLDNYTFPSKDSIISKIDGEIIADSCEVRVFYTSFYGDSLASLKCVLHEMSRPMEEGVKYPSNFSPIENGFVRTDGGIHKEKVYAITDLSIPASDRLQSIPNFRITLNEPYTDKAGKSYNNYGSYVMNKFYENPNNFKNSYQFIHNVCPGFFFETKSGVGSMAYTSLTQLNVYFRYMTKDSIFNGVASFVGTEEVLQKTQITQDKATIEKLASDESCTYLKTPSGIYTQITIPVDDIIKGHDNDTLNTARVVMQRYNDKVQSDYSLPAPETLLVLPTDSLETFFVNNKIADYRNSFLASFNSSTNSYTINNIGSMIRTMATAKNDYIAKHGITEAQYQTLHPNWNKAIVVPVETSYSTIQQTEVLTRVINSMKLTSTRLVGGKANEGAVKINVVYTRFDK